MLDKNKIGKQLALLRKGICFKGRKNIIRRALIFGIGAFYILEN